MMREAPPKRFTAEPMVAVMAWLRERIAETEEGGSVVFEVLDPDRCDGCYAGQSVEIGGTRYLHRGYKAWTDLAELLYCRMLTPTRVSDATVQMRFRKLVTAGSFHRAAVKETSEKYGLDSPFFEIRKQEEPAFLAAYMHALRQVGLHRVRSVLNLGINTADEFALIETMAPERFGQMRLTGIDHSASALAYARRRFPGGNVAFVEHDINAIGELDLGRFDLIVTIGTLQSPGIDFKPLFMSLVQNHLNPGGAMILGFPNCRWSGGEMIYGAKAPNYPFSEQSLLYKDVYFCKKYLQQKKFRVTLSGKPYLFLTAVSIRKSKEAVSRTETVHFSLK